MFNTEIQQDTGKQQPRESLQECMPRLYELARQMQGEKSCRKEEKNGTHDL